VNLLLLLALTHLCFPKARQQTRRFFETSYYNSESGRYASGWDDAYLVAFWIVLFTAIRASVIDFVLIPFGRRAGIEKQKDLTRFAEQGWLLVYYILFVPLGMVG
jgi:acyl-CoA-dependent ceramide synthase